VVYFYTISQTTEDRHFWRCLFVAICCQISNDLVRINNDLLESNLIVHTHNVSLYGSVNTTSGVETSWTADVHIRAVIRPLVFHAKARLARRRDLLRPCFYRYCQFACKMCMFWAVVFVQ
jgi:hypothetical protein